MFGLGALEIVAIVFFILIFYGPEQLPKVAKKGAFFFRHLRLISEEVTLAVKREVKNLEKMAELENLNDDKTLPVEKAPSEPLLQENSEAKKEVFNA